MLILTLPFIERRRRRTTSCAANSKESKKLPRQLRAKRPTLTPTLTLAPTPKPNWKAELARAEAVQVQEEASAQLMAAKQDAEDTQQALAASQQEARDWPATPSNLPRASDPLIFSFEAADLREKLDAQQQVAEALKQRAELLESQTEAAALEGLCSPTCSPTPTARSSNLAPPVAGLQSATRGAEEWQRRAEAAEAKLAAEPSSTKPAPDPQVAVLRRELAEAKVVAEKEAKDAAAAKAALESRVHDAEARVEVAEGARKATAQELREVKKQLQASQVIHTIYVTDM